MKNDIPKSVIKEAEGLIDLYGNNFDYLGEYQERDAYLFVFPKNKLTGFPFVFLYDTKDQNVETITGFDALDIIDEFEK